MVYWGCGTRRNRLAWAWVLALGGAGVALFSMGAAKLDACKYISLVLGSEGSTCSFSPKSMMLAGAALIVAALPPLLFFSGCAAAPLGAVGARGTEQQQSDITVVRQGANGAALTYKYDAAGRLVSAPGRLAEEGAERAAAARRGACGLSASGVAVSASWGRASPKLCETYVPRVWDSSSCYVDASPRGAAPAKQAPPHPHPHPHPHRCSADDAGAQQHGGVVPVPPLYAAEGAGGLSPLHAGRRASLARAESELYSVPPPPPAGGSP
ncbi:MAG: hypothetical protein J3K34DRAFT_518130 [Monoraphidium minutum]|nr:MAG: hypothetical protein J3K34DRAFT_518130 [Monoraphidium minutum]